VETACGLCYNAFTFGPFTDDGVFHHQSPEVVLRRYETLLIAKPDLEEPQLKALLDDVTALIIREGGVVKSVDVWGLRRLEYPIEHQESGHYAVINFESDTGVIKELERVLGIRDDVLRTKTLVMEKG
jgi:small subunit ribosomal protein S6